MAVAPYFDRSALAASQVLAGFDSELFRRKLESTTVGIALSDQPSIGSEGDHLLDLLTRILARLYPNLDIDGPTPASERITRLAKSVNPSIETTTVGRADVGVSVGLADARFGTTVFAGSLGWDALISTSSPQSVGNTRNPFGAGAAACFAAANVFRSVFEASGGDLDRDSVFSTFSMSSRRTPADVPNDGWSLTEEAVLGGIGAIGMSAAWAISRSPLSGLVHLVDNEDVEESNLQRYVLAQIDDIGHPKVAVASRGADTTVVFQAHRMNWRSFVSTHGYKWHWALAAFDSAEARRELQASLPRWIANAWTQPGDLGVSVHPQFGLSEACLSCLYLPEKVERNEDQLVADALGIPGRLLEVRNLLHLGSPVEKPLLLDVAKALGVSPDDASAFEGRPIRELYVRGVCGGALIPLGRGDAGRVHVPLAHQSALAGVLLAARLGREAARKPIEAAEVTRIDIQKPLGVEVTQPVLRRHDGRCLCDDRDFVDRYRQKYA